MHVKTVEHYFVTENILGRLHAMINLQYYSTFKECRTYILTKNFWGICTVFKVSKMSPYCSFPLFCMFKLFAIFKKYIDMKGYTYVLIFYH